MTTQLFSQSCGLEILIRTSRAGGSVDQRLPAGGSKTQTAEVLLEPRTPLNGLSLHLHCYAPSVYLHN